MSDEAGDLTWVRTEGLEMVVSLGQEHAHSQLDLTMYHCWAPQAKSLQFQDYPQPSTPRQWWDLPHGSMLLPNAESFLGDLTGRTDFQRGLYNKEDLPLMPRT